MKYLSKALIAFVAVEHLFILWIEIFAWQTVGSSVFSVFSADFFSLTTSMAANQGLYNGFLAAGLIWAFIIKNRKWSFNISCFFLICVLIAGIFGAFTIQNKIFFTQGIPALISLIVLFIARKPAE